MAYDEGLAERIRAVLDGDPRVVEKKMFGGVAFLLDGKMFVGIVKDELMVRVGPAGHEEALKDPQARTMDFTGRPMAGYVFVSPEGTSEEAALGRWIGLGRAFAATLVGKTARSKKARSKQAARPPRAKAARRKR
jgi:TfoX/Sxy family transcriptional regulator of competence genes